MPCPVSKYLPSSPFSRPEQTLRGKGGRCRDAGALLRPPLPPLEAWCPAGGWPRRGSETRDQ